MPPRPREQREPRRSSSRSCCRWCSSIALALVQVGLLVRDRLLVESAARAGARAAAIQADPGAVNDAVVGSVHGLDPSGITVSIARSGAQGDPVTVTVGYVSDGAGAPGLMALRRLRLDALGCHRSSGVLTVIRRSPLRHRNDAAIGTTPRRTRVRLGDHRGRGRDHDRPHPGRGRPGYGAHRSRASARGGRRSGARGRPGTGDALRIAAAESRLPTTPIGTARSLLTCACEPGSREALVR